MPLSPNDITLVAQAILDRLSYQDVQWAVVEVTPAEETEFALPAGVLREGLVVPRSMLVRAAKVSDLSCRINAYFTFGIPTQRAIMQMASSLQDGVIETVRAAVPVCPAHSHPLSARLEGELAVWGCPLNIGLFEPIYDMGQDEISDDHRLSP